MDSTSKFTEAEQAFRWEVVLALLPHYGKSTDQLLVAATSVQEHVEGLLRGKLADTVGTASANDPSTSSTHL